MEIKLKDFTSLIDIPVQDPTPLLADDGDSRVEVSVFKQGSATAKIKYGQGPEILMVSVYGP